MDRTQHPPHPTESTTAFSRAARGIRVLAIVGLVALMVSLFLSRAPALAQEQQPPTPSADLGDAPDSLSNHHGIDNMAYPGVKGRFPTVWEGTPAGEGTGPRHAAPKIVWLGDKVSLENEADQGPDEDLDSAGKPINNILNGGADNADNDGADDGWLNRAARFQDCRETELIVRVSKGPGATGDFPMYLNVWFDGNRDGDWADSHPCEDNQRLRAHEWIVQNFVVNMGAITGTHADIKVGTVLVSNEKPGEPVWLRFTLSDRRAPAPSTNQVGAVVGPPDGRGPDYPAAYELGETEDYLHKPDHPDIAPDLGDAPDSTNHYGLTNPAYPSAGVAGQFPTVWEGKSPSGPRHANPYAVWLGDRVSSEKDADQLPDMDPTTNILDNGGDANASNQDDGDDGWLNARFTRFLDCKPEKLEVRVARNPAFQGGKMYLNVYFDGNRSGDWGQKKECGKSPDDPNQTVYGHEWIVQNFVIDTSVITGRVDLEVPTLLVMNDKPDAHAWVRFMLSEEPVPALSSGEHDGRGPQDPDQFQLGETEDYFWKPPVPQEAKPDLGDAPDSTNHHGLKNPAYPTVDGNFPTVWEGSTPSGPMHADPYVIWLGKDVSSEKDADQLPDMDPTTNILDNGANANASNKDEFDDGWLNREHTRFPDCEETTLRVRITKKATANPARMFLNVYFDGNRSGDWGQRKVCDPVSSTAAGTTYAHEWIVQNFPVPVPAAATAMDIIVPTMKVLNNRPKLPAWVRFTLSEEPVVELAPFVHDGRGPQSPAHYKVGETEDYLYKPPDDQGEPGKIVVEKSTSVAGGVVKVGDAYTYTVEIAHVGGTAPASIAMTDVLPAQVHMIRGPIVTELNPSVAPLFASFDSSVGHSGAIKWHGLMSPDSRIKIEFYVGVRFCPPPERQVIHNVAQIFNRDGQKIAEATADLRTECQQPKKPEITLVKRVIRDPESEVQEPEQPNQPEAEVPIVGGRPVAYGLALQAQTTIVSNIVVTDEMPAGVVATAVQVDRGEAIIRKDGRLVLWKLRIAPDLGPARARIDVRPTDQLECDQLVRNVAHWALYEGDELLHSGQSNPAVIYRVCADLGDAPDSTNHFGKDMMAYPTVKANFPTVYDPATGADRGPKHLFTRPLHLGHGVTEEREADRGIDADPTNNIKPRLNKANLDLRDDGLVRSELAFSNCQTAKIPVLVSIDANALAHLPQDAQGIGYINVWLDSNRDGDWNDVQECPTAEGQVAKVSWEHIVVDHPVDVKALGPGLHKIYLTTNWPVWWPADLSKDLPAWMRISITGRPSNKVLDCGAGTCHIGDGRGYDVPFIIGETEDYLVRPVRQGEPPSTEGADPAVRKEGRLIRGRGPVTGQAFWLAQWLVDYQNRGHGTASNVLVTDVMEGPQTFEGGRSIPALPVTSLGNTRTYTIETLGPGAHGLISIRSTLPATTTPGTVITNTVTITAATDADVTNDTSVVTLTVPLLPPRFTYPTPGTTCTGSLTITGLAQPGVSVDLTIEDSVSGTTVVSTTVTPDAGGQWSYATTLADGEYDITAVARLGSQSSPPETVHVIVDSTLFWNPLSLRITDGEGHVIIPHDSSGRTDASGWSVFLRRGTTYTVTLQVCCTSTPVVELELGNVATLTLTDLDGDGTYSATFTTPDTGPITGAIRVCVTCNLIRQCSDGEVTIDPEGTVFDILTGQALSGSSVACMAEEVSSAGGESVFSLWPAADFGQVNPQTTGSDGYFSFFTPAGTYRLEVSKSGYQDYRSEDLNVTTEPVHFDVPLTPDVTDAAGQEVVITDEGFEPQVLTVEPGTVIQFTNMSTQVRASKSITPTASFGASAAALKSSDAWDSGLLNAGESYKRQLTTEGTYTYVDTTNPTATGTIIVKQSEPQAPTQNIYLPAVNR